MSLRSFHIFFIVVSTALCLGMIFWGVYYFKTTGEWTGFVYSALGVVGTVLLLRYLKWFRHKYARFLTVAMGAMLSGYLQLSASPVFACSTCYQDPDSPLTQGTIWGVWFLLAVIVAVLVSVAWIAHSWQRRARALRIEL